MLFSTTKKIKKIGFSKCRSDHFRGPNRRILGQGIGQNFNRTIFEKVEKTVIFSTFWKNAKKSSFFDGFLYSKLPIHRPWRPNTGCSVNQEWFRRPRMVLSTGKNAFLGRLFMFNRERHIGQPETFPLDQRASLG